MLYYFFIVFVSVILHELGHLLSSLYFKIKVKAVSVGFGKILFRKKWKDIEWRISLIPFGGYCDIEEDINKSNSLSSLKYWKQVIILCSGVFVNFLIASICYLYMHKSIIYGIVIDLFLIKNMCIKNYLNVAMTINYLNINSYIIQISVLNLFLAITNLLPIPALDGGYLWMFPIRKKIGEKLFAKIMNISFKFLIVFQLILIIYWWIL